MDEESKNIPAKGIIVSKARSVGRSEWNAALGIKSGMEPFGQSYGHGKQFEPEEEIPIGINIHKSSSPDWSVGCVVTKESMTFDDLYKNYGDYFTEQQKQALSNFPETSGPELTYVGGIDPINGGTPSSIIFEEAGILSRLRELNQTKAGGVEPPAFITAKDMANELESLPKSFVEAALDPEETGEVEIILGELKRQGEGFAVAMTRKEEFDDLNLFNMASEPKLQRVNPVTYGSPARDVFAQHVLDERSMVVMRDPGLFR